MNNYKSSAELKGMAKEQLFDKYGTVIGASVLLILITFLLQLIPIIIIDSASIVGYIILNIVNFIISLFMGIFSSGRAFLYLKVTCRQNISVGDMFYGFKSNRDKAIFIQLVLSLISYISLVPMAVFEYLYMQTHNVIFVLLVSIFAIIGSIIYTIFSLIFAQAFYLLQDFPEYSAKELLKMSSQIMKGHKGRLFYLQISFIPLFILGIFSCCIAFLWILPYRSTTMANFYMDLMKNRKTE